MERRKFLGAMPLAVGGAVALGSMDLSAQTTTSDAPWLANVAALRAATTSSLSGTACQLLGYSTNGDGGQGLLIVGENAADNGGTIINDASGRSWYRAGYSNWLSVKWFGAMGNGSNDDTTAIQNAIDAANGTVFFPAGAYKVSSSLSIAANGIWLVGESKITSQINPSGSFNVFNFTNANGAGLRSMAVSYGTAPSAGVVVNVNTCGDLAVEDIYFYRPFIGIQVMGIAAPFTLQNFNISNPMTAGVVINQPTPGTNNGGGVVINSGTMSAESGTSANGIVLQGGDTFTLSNINIYLLNTGVILAPASGNAVQWVLANNVLCDTCVNNGWLFTTASGGVLKGIELNNCWGSSNGGVGFQIQGGDGIDLVGCRAFNNQLQGFSLSIGENIHLSSCVGAGNGTAAANSQGASVNAGISNFSIVGCTFGPVSGMANTQNYGIYVSPGASNNYLITNNWLHGNVVSGLSDGGTGTNKVVSCNLS